MADKPQSLAQPNGHGATQAPVAELAQLLDAHRGDHHIMVFQNYPDPRRDFIGVRAPVDRHGDGPNPPAPIPAFCERLTGRGCL